MFLLSLFSLGFISLEPCPCWGIVLSTIIGGNTRGVLLAVSSLNFSKIDSRSNSNVLDNVWGQY